MIDDMKKSIPDYSDESVKGYLRKILAGEAFDKLGLIYGMGHAIYSLSDPRANVLRNMLFDKNNHFNHTEDIKLYQQVYKFAPEVIGETRKLYKGIAVNIDFYTGYIYNMLKIPREMFTPIFAIARIAGWSAHRIEELANNSKIIRPAYVAVGARQDYVEIENREPSLKI
jgi:citrate synthase